MRFATDKDTAPPKADFPLHLNLR